VAARKSTKNAAEKKHKKSLRAEDLCTCDLCFYPLHTSALDEGNPHLVYYILAGIEKQAIILLLRKGMEVKE